MDTVAHLQDKVSLANNGFSLQVSIIRSISGIVCAFSQSVFAQQFKSFLEVVGSGKAIVSRTRRSEHIYRTPKTSSSQYLCPDDVLCTTSEPRLITITSVGRPYYLSVKQQPSPATATRNKYSSSCAFAWRCLLLPCSSGSIPWDEASVIVP